MLSERLKIAMQKSGLSQADLARACKIKPPSIHGWLSGKAKFLRGENLLSAANALNVSQQWLATGRGPMQVKEGSTNFISTNMGAKSVPIINYVQAGQWKEIIEHPLPEDPSEWLTTDLELSSQAFALEIKGDSMLPDFKEGDRVIIDPTVAPNPGDFVVSRNAQFEATFKKYRSRGLNEKGEELIELVPLNLDYPIIRSDMSPVVIIGTMVEHRKYRRK